MVLPHQSASAINSAISFTKSFPSFPVDFTASSKRETSYGQQTANISAPVSTASRTRFSERRSLTWSAMKAVEPHATATAATAVALLSATSHFDQFNAWESPPNNSLVHRYSPLCLTEVAGVVKGDFIIQFFCEIQFFHQRGEIGRIVDGLKFAAHVLDTPFRRALRACGSVTNDFIDLVYLLKRLMLYSRQILRIKPCFASQSLGVTRAFFLRAQYAIIRTQEVEGSVPSARLASCPLPW